MRIYLTRRQCELVLQQLSYNNLGTAEKLELLEIEVRMKNVCAKQCASDRTMLNGLLRLENLMNKKENNNG